MHSANVVGLAQFQPTTHPIGTNVSPRYQHGPSGPFAIHVKAVPPVIAPSTHPTYVVVGLDAGGAAKPSPWIARQPGVPLQVASSRSAQSGGESGSLEQATRSVQMIAVARAPASSHRGNEVISRDGVASYGPKPVCQLVPSLHARSSVEADAPAHQRTGDARNVVHDVQPPEPGP